MGAWGTEWNANDSGMDYLGGELFGKEFFKKIEKGLESCFEEVRVAAHTLVVLERSLYTPPLDEGLELLVKAKKALEAILMSDWCDEWVNPEELRDLLRQEIKDILDILQDTDKWWHREGEMKESAKPILEGINL